MWHRTAYVFSLLIVLAVNGMAQIQMLPPIKIDRRGDGAYMDSLAGVAKRQYQYASTLPATPRHDSLRFESLYFLGRLYGRWTGRKDSILYYGNELARQARERRNIEFEVRGILLNEYYYHNVLQNYPAALRVNFQALAALQRVYVLPPIAWRVEMNLGELYSISGDTTNALRFMNRALTKVLKTKGISRTDLISYRMEIEQKIAFVYFDHNFLESEKHFLNIESLFSDKDHKSNQAYSYDDLSELYLKYERFDKAIVYGQKAATIWEQMKHPVGTAGSWSTLACAYAGQGQHELALQYAKRVFDQPKPIYFARRRAHFARYQVFEQQGDWANSLKNYKHYIILRDSAESDLRAKELATIQKRAELDQLTIQNQQAQQLQAQRLLTLQKQAELDRLRASTEADALTKKAQLTEQQRQLDNQKAQLLLTEQQNRQKSLQQSFRQERLQQENQIQQNWLFYIGSSLLFLIGVLSLLLYSQRLRKRQIKAELQLTEEQNQANINILNAQETERRRLAQDLHDDIGTSLLALRGKLPPTNPDAHHLLDQIITDVRAVSHNLMPDELATLGLSGALNEAARRLEESSGIRFLFVSAGEVVPLSQVAELALYRAVLELMHNVVKHSGATEAVVQLVYHADLLNVTVEDNGKGFANHTVTSDGGIGLKNVASRTEWLGGKLAIDSSAAGTTIRLDIPYDSHAI